MASSMPLSSAQSATALYEMQAADQKIANAARATKTNANARAASQDFESVFLNSMFSQMFTGIDGDGPFGGTPAIGVWRSFLTQEYARSLAKNGGIGIADHVYTSLMAQQEVGAR
jgi:Rod binding domain-containing protein